MATPLPGLEQEDWVGITTAAAALDKGDGLVQWANRVGLEGTSLDQYRREHRGAGVAKHHTLELIATDRGHELPDEEVARLGPWLEACGGRILAAEHKVEHPELRYRGRIDAIRLAHRESATILDERLFVEGESPITSAWQLDLPVVAVDWKSYGRTYPQDHLQLAGYVHALRAQGFTCVGAEIVQPHGAGLRVTRGVATDADWLCVLACYRAGERIRRKLDTL